MFNSPVPVTAPPDPAQGAQRGAPVHERERGAGGGVRRPPGQRPVRPRARALPRVPRAQAGHRGRAAGHAGRQLPLPAAPAAALALLRALQPGASAARPLPGRRAIVTVGYWRRTRLHEIYRCIFITITAASIFVTYFVRLY